MVSLSYRVSAAATTEGPVVIVHDGSASCRRDSRVRCNLTTTTRFAFVTDRRCYRLNACDKIKGREIMVGSINYTLTE